MFLISSLTATEHIEIISETLQAAPFRNVPISDRTMKSTLFRLRRAKGTTGDGKMT